MNVEADALAPAALVALPEPGACGWRMDPDQVHVPEWLAGMLDWHVRPSANPWAAPGRARIACRHVDWELVWHRWPDLFTRRQQVGVPDPASLWTARQALTELGYELILEVQLELVGDDSDDLAAAVYGAGVAGVLGTRGWEITASLLTTCVSTLREPEPAFLAAVNRDPLAPIVVEPQPHHGRPIPSRVWPHAWLRGAWMHTWWSYPAVGHLREGCTCPAHRPGLGDLTFGPAKGLGLSPA